MITIIDYNTCNVGSIQNMYKKIGFHSIITNRPEDVPQASHIIIPGVGAFDKGMQNLKSLGMLPVLNNAAANGVPILGICLGFQLLSKSSEEGSGSESGLGWIDADTVKFSFENESMRIPHMGWNTLNNTAEAKLFKGMPVDHRFYFVHSYYVRCKNPEDSAATTHYGLDFSSAIEKDNIFGVQFHPEKSHKYGMTVLKNFAEVKSKAQ